MQINTHFYSGELSEIDYNTLTVKFFLKKEFNCFSHNFLFELEIDQEVDKISFIIENAMKSDYYKGWFNYKPYYYSDKWIKVDESEVLNNKFCFAIVKPPQKMRISWYPDYSYEHLNNHLLNLINLNEVNITYLTTFLPVITIGKQQEPYIIIFARQHPGEYMSSYFIEGLINSIIKTSINKSFIIFPIVNLSGASSFNHRFDIKGMDLNRIWHQNYSNEINSIKDYLKKIKKISLFVDVHGDEVSKINYISYNKITKEINKLFSIVKQDIPIIDFIKQPNFLKRFAKSLLYNHKILLNRGTLASEYFLKKYNTIALTIEISAHSTSDIQTVEIGELFGKILNEKKWC